jgi:hypothetical protein
MTSSCGSVAGAGISFASAIRGWSALATIHRRLQEQVCDSHSLEERRQENQMKQHTLRLPKSPRMSIINKMLPGTLDHRVIVPTLFIQPEIWECIFLIFNPVVCDDRNISVAHDVSQ